MVNAAAISVAEQATFQAALAQQSGTFAVAGVLIDKTGNVWKTMQNREIVNNITSDITAHAERQLVSWYFNQKLNYVPLPDPGQMTIVTTLDPCMMCTGALLESGINVIVISYDTVAGVNWECDQTFFAVPEHIRWRARRQFSYFGLDNGQRNFAGSQLSMFRGAVIPTSIDVRSSSMIRDSAQTISQKIKDLDPTPYNIRDLGDESPQLKLLQRHYAAAGKQQADLTIPAQRTFLLIAMERVAEETRIGPHLRNSAALIDPFHNVLLILGYARDGLTTSTPFMRLISAYTACRRRASGAADGALPHTKHCTIVLLNGPGREATDVMDLGLWGLPAIHPRNLYYYHAQQTPQKLAAMHQAFPPLYGDTINRTPIQLDNGL